MELATTENIFQGKQCIQPKSHEMLLLDKHTLFWQQIFKMGPSYPSIVNKQIAVANKSKWLQQTGTVTAPNSLLRPVRAPLNRCTFPCASWKTKVCALCLHSCPCKDLAKLSHFNYVQFSSRRDHSGCRMNPRESSAMHRPLLSALVSAVSLELTTRR